MKTYEETKEDQSLAELARKTKISFCTLRDNIARRQIAFVPHTSGRKAQSGTPEDYKKAIRLYVEEKKSFQEAARIASVNPSTLTDKVRSLGLSRSLSEAALCKIKKKK